MKFHKLGFFKKMVGIAIILLGFISIGGGYIFSKTMRPRMISISQSLAENEVSGIIDTEVKRLMLEEFLNYDKITIISRDEAGRVTSISANSVLINNFANELDIAIGERIENKDLIENQIYLSSLLGIDILTGMGPKVPIRFQPVSVTHADISHTFEVSGINQTLHTVILDVSVDIEILMPFAYSTITVTSNMPIAQTLIVGNVPEAYLNRQK